ncbi:MAG: cyclic nucleotide-binding domain-containing protein [Caldilineaceae bacterium]|nr:cyclic nucleotide-binding domain-containing protein [Caldilineaceae bacterium]
MNVELIRRTPLFADLAEADAAQVASIFRSENRARGSVIFNSGEKAHSLYLVESGFIRLIDANGMALATLGPGSLLGEAEFLRGADHVMSAIAAGDVSLLAMTDEALRRLFQKHPEVGVLLTHSFGEQLVQMEDYLIDRLAETDLLGDLPPNILRTLAVHLRPHVVRASSMLYRTGEPPRGLFLLENGLIELRPSAEEDNAQRVENGEIFGALPLLTHKPYSDTAWAVEDSLIWVLPLNDFHRVSSHFPAVRRTLGRRVRSKLSPADQTQAVIRLAQTSIFANMGPQNLHAIAQRLVLQHVTAGEIIYRAGDSGDALYLVDDGEVELTTETPTGVVQEVDRIEPGRFFGEMSLLTGKNRANDATTLRDTNLWVLYKADLDELVALYPTIGSTLNQVVAAKLAADEGAVEEGRYRRFPLLAKLTGRDLREVVRYLHPTRYRSGEQIVRAGAPGEMLYLIERGSVRMQPSVGEAGWTLREGEIFGERSVLTNQLHAQTAYAETEVDLLTLDREDLEALMMRVPSLAMSLSRLLSQRSEAAVIVDEGPERSQGAVLSSQRRRSAAARQAPSEPVRPGIGEWFSNLSGGAKLKLVLLVLLLTYLFTVAAWASFNALISGPTVAAGGAPVVSASVLNSVEASNRVDRALAASANDSNLIALALTEDAEATPTYTPYPTETAVPTSTPTNTPIPTDTPVPPTATPVPVQPRAVQVAQVAQAAPPPAPEEPQPQARSAPAQPSRAWDGRLSQLGVNVADASVGSGQPYWQLVEARWENEAEAGGKHHIYVEVLDENGQRIVGQPVSIFWSDGGDMILTEDKPAPEYASNYPMYKAGNSYNIKVEGLPSDVLQGAGLGTPDLPFHTIHTNVLVTFRKAVKP